MEIDDGILSLVTISMLMNSTTFNQGNHCTVTHGLLRPPVDVGNQALVVSEATCRQLNANLQDELKALAERVFNDVALTELTGAFS